MTELPLHVTENRRYWDAMADDWVAAGEWSWAASQPTWGIWGRPESELGMLPASMDGMRAIELGCGTGYVSAWMAARGAAVVAVDNSERQLATARRLAVDHGVSIDFRHGNAESVDEPDASFDFAVSEYGAAIWCDPDRWIPEAHRLLRTGGRLVFLGSAPFASVCTPADGSATTTELHRPYFGMQEFDWRHVENDPGGWEFNRTISDWFSLFRSVGFQVDDYLEPRPGPEHDGPTFGTTPEWARSWPSEQVWKLTKR